MTIYEIICDVDRFQSLKWRLTDQAWPFHLDFNGEPMQFALVPPEVYFFRPKLERGDFWKFNHSFAMPQESLSKVRPFVDEAGELLPVPCEGEIFSVLNVLRCVDCLDISQFVRNDYANYKFDVARVPKGIFKPILPAGDGRLDPYVGIQLYVSEITADPATEFKAFVENENMTGLIFRRVWSSEG